MRFSNLLVASATALVGSAFAAKLEPVKQFNLAKEKNIVNAVTDMPRHVSAFSTSPELLAKFLSNPDEDNKFIIVDITPPVLHEGDVRTDYFDCLMCFYEPFYRPDDVDEADVDEALEIGRYLYGTAKEYDAKYIIIVAEHNDQTDFLLALGVAKAIQRTDKLKIVFLIGGVSGAAEWARMEENRGKFPPGILPQTDTTIEPLSASKMAPKPDVKEEKPKRKSRAKPGPTVAKPGPTVNIPKTIKEVDEEDDV